MREDRAIYPEALLLASSTYTGFNSFDLTWINMDDRWLSGRKDGRQDCVENFDKLATKSIKCGSQTSRTS
jgi:hypothetical protein